MSVSRKKLELQLHLFFCSSLCCAYADGGDGVNCGYGRSEKMQCRNTEAQPNVQPFDLRLEILDHHDDLKRFYFTGGESTS